MTDWQTTKIKASVKEEAKELDATYTDIMQAGIDALTTESTTNGDTVTTSPTTNGGDEVVTEVVDEIKNELSMVADPAVSEDEIVQRISKRLDDLENELPRKVAREIQK